MIGDRSHYIMGKVFGDTAYWHDNAQAAQMRPTAIRERGRPKRTSPHIRYKFWYVLEIAEINRKFACLL